MKFTFWDFILVEATLTEGGEGSGRPGDNDRPKKSLWFKNSGLWHGDMNRNWSGSELSIINSTGDSVTMSGGEDEEITDDLYVVDKDQNCYGCWKKSYGRGITFNKPRPLNTVKHKSGF